MLQTKTLISLACVAAAIAAIACVGATTTAHATEKRNLGLVGVKNENGTWLQAWSNGQVHVNQKRGSEETWFLIAVSRTEHIYAFANYRTGNFLTKQVGSVGCVNASSPGLSTAAEWKVIPGKPSVDAVALRNVADGTLLSDNGGIGSNFRPDVCPGGEGSATTTTIPTGPSRDWGGWWDLRSVSKPDQNPGKDSIMGEAVNAAPVPIPIITSL
jgi:hypothetical protein